MTGSTRCCLDGSQARRLCQSWSLVVLCSSRCRSLSSGCRAEIFQVAHRRVISRAARQTSGRGHELAVVLDAQSRSAAKPPWLTPERPAPSPHALDRRKPVSCRCPRHRRAIEAQPLVGGSDAAHSAYRIFQVGSPLHTALRSIMSRASRNIARSITSCGERRNAPGMNGMRVLGIVSSLHKRQGNHVRICVLKFKSPLCRERVAKRSALRKRT